MPASQQKAPVDERAGHLLAAAGDGDGRCLPEPETALSGSRLTGGSVLGNERLTAANGVILIALLAALGVTIVRIRPLIDEHLFIGLLLLGPIALKLGSTGYRFARYYTNNAVYRERGAPPLPLRVLGPLVLVATVAVFATGVALLVEGPGASPTLRTFHKVSFIVWTAVTAAHVLGHLPDIASTLLTRRRVEPGGTARYEYNRLAAGGIGRTLALSGAIVAGAVVAVLLIPHFGGWTHFESIRHHH